MPVTNNQLTPLQEEVVGLYSKKLQKEASLKRLIAQKRNDIQTSKRRTVDKLNRSSEAISQSYEGTQEAFSASVANINATYADLVEIVGPIEIEGGENHE